MFLKNGICEIWENRSSRWPKIGFTAQQRSFGSMPNEKPFDDGGDLRAPSHALNGNLAVDGTATMGPWLNWTTMVEWNKQPGSPSNKDRSNKVKMLRLLKVFYVTAFGFVGCILLCEDRFCTNGVGWFCQLSFIFFGWHNHESLQRYPKISKRYPKQRDPYLAVHKDIRR